MSDQPFIFDTPYASAGFSSAYDEFANNIFGGGAGGGFPIYVTDFGPGGGGINAPFNFESNVTNPNIAPNIFSELTNGIPQWVFVVLIVLGLYWTTQDS